MDVDDRLRDLEIRLKTIEQRLVALEGPATTVEATGEGARPPLEDATPVFDLALVGKAVLILGGAFLLRAATESATFPKQVGVTLGLLYAVAWVVIAIRSKRVLIAATAAFIAYPIVWEATTRFGVLTAPMAAAILTIGSAALIIAARRYSMDWLAWIAAAGATFDALLLAYATQQLVPFMIELTLIGAVALMLSMRYVAWLLAIESDLFTILLIALTLIDDKRPATLISLLLLGTLWLVKPGIPAVSGALIGFGGAAAIVMQRNLPPATTAIAILTVAAIAYFFSFQRDETYDSIVAGIAALCGSLIVLAPAPRAIVWGLAAVVTAEIARRRSSTAFAIQSTVWGGAAAVSSLPVAAPFCFGAFVRRRSIVLLAIAAGGAAAFAIQTTSQPLLRTIILAIAALALGFAGRQWQIREASQLAIVALVVTGAQIAMQGFSAAMMFIALAVYGGAMLAIARLRRVVVT